MNIFVFTAGNQSAQQHLQDTVENSVDENTLREFLSDDDFNNLNSLEAMDVVIGRGYSEQYNQVMKYVMEFLVSVNEKKKLLKKKLWLKMKAVQTT